MNTVPDDAVQVLPAAAGHTNVYVHLNVVYATRDGRDLHLQIVQPSGDASQLGWEAAFAGRYPCIAFVQGSGWREQALGASLAYACRFAERGFVVAIVEYRPSDVAPHPAQVHDAKAAVEWLRAHADEYGIDPARMVLAGDSSGGHTALMLHATDSSLGLTHVVAFYPPTDLTLMTHDDAVRDLLGEAFGDRAAVVAAGPAHHLDGSPRAPLLLVHGTADDVVPPVHSTAYAEVLRAGGHPCEVVLVEGAGHGVWPAMFTRELADVVQEFLGR